MNPIESSSMMEASQVFLDDVSEPPQFSLTAIRKVAHIADRAITPEDAGI